MKTGRGNIPAVKFGDMSGGIANAYPPHSIKQNQVAYAINALFEKVGISKHNGFTGLATRYNYPIRGFFCFKKTDGTEIYIVVYNSRVYSVDLTDGTTTLLYTLSNDNQCYAVSVLGKLWLVNGADVIKIESSTVAYRVGIVKPSGFTATAGSGGSLSAGTYQVYASYSRVVGSATLHSEPQLVNATLSVGASGTVIVAVTASTDPQVTNITIWMTDANGSTLYYYGNAANTTGNITISSSANKNSNLLMYEEAAGNQLPPALTNVWLCDGRLMGCVASSNIVYYSLKSQNVYDLERWPTEYYIPTMPFTSLSGYVVGSDLFVNTVGGLYRFSGCDLSSKPQAVIPGSMCNTSVLYFPKNNLRSVVEYNNMLIGVTNDGIRIFDGERFSIDLSKHIKPFVDKISNSSSNFNPAALIYRRSGKRTEYRVSYNDSEYSSVSHNRALILNLDSLIIEDNENYNAQWELSSNGFCGGLVNSNNIIFVAQHNASIGLIATEQGASNYLCLSEAGVLLTEATAIKIYIKTRSYINELAGMDHWERIYLLRMFSDNCIIRLLIEDNNLYSFPTNFASTGGNRVVVGGPSPLIIPFVLSSDAPEERFYKVPQNAIGNTLALEIEQNAIDNLFSIYEIEVYGFHEWSNFS